MSNHSSIGSTGRSALRTWLVALCLALACATSQAAEPAPPFNARFISIAFHDVVDSKAELDDDAVTTDRLVAFFDWLRGNAWTAISIDDVLRAQRGEKPLPPRAVLISFDDGYRSLYTRVYPLALAYRMPIVAALVGDWTGAPAGTSVRYGNRELPREHFITWDQAREMQRSGLVEFALHTQSMHQEVLGNPQGNTMPAANTLRYDPATGYESEAAFTARLRADLARGRALLQRELGRAPRVLVLALWPLQRDRPQRGKGAWLRGVLVARRQHGQCAGSDAPARPGRTLVAGTLPAHARPVAGRARRQPATRPERTQHAGPAELPRSGRAVVRRTGHAGRAAGARDRARRVHWASPASSWTPCSATPRAASSRPGSRIGSCPWPAICLARIAWQMQTRAGVEVYVRLPHRAAATALGSDAARVRRLYEDLGAMVPLSGWLMEDMQLGRSHHACIRRPASVARRCDTHAAGLGAPGSFAIVAALHLDRLRAAGAPDALGWDAYAALAFARPAMRLLWLAKQPSDGNPVAPHPLTEFTLVPASLDQATDEAQVDPRLTRWYTGASPPDPARLAEAAIDYQRKGGVALGWCPDDPIGDQPEAAIAAPGVSGLDLPGPTLKAVQE